MKYNYKVRIMSDEDQWMEIEVECAEAKQVVQIINKHFGFELVSRDSVYNYFNRRHLCSKKVFGIRGFVSLERHQLKPKKKKKCKTNSASECSHPAACQ